jgi:hypothetical protein
MKKTYTARTESEKRNQNRFFFWYKKENRDWIRKTLERLNKPNLVDKLLGKRRRGRLINDIRQ